MTRACAAFLLAVLLIPGRPPIAERGQTPASSAQTAYVIALDGKSQTIIDLTAADFIVKEDGKACLVIAAEVAAAPMEVAILVDDNGTGMFRYGVSNLIQRLQGQAEVTLSVVEGQVRKVVDYTADVNVLLAGAGHLGVRPSTPDGGQLLEGIFEAAKELKGREARRPVIIALTVGGDEHSPLDARYVLDRLHESRAALHVVLATSQSVRTMSPATRPGDLLEGNLNLSQVLGDGPKQSGGRRHEIVATAAVMAELQQIANELRNQYVVTYQRPDGAKTPRNLDVSVRRKGVTAIAPTRVPVR
jgi:hypothetical protein